MFLVHLIFVRVVHSFCCNSLSPFWPLICFVYLPILPGLCGVIEQKDEGGQQPDSACGAQTQPGHAGLCEYEGFV